MPALSSAIYPEPLRSIDSATFTGSYQALGTPLTNPSRLIKFTNNSSVLVTLSWDGITDHEVIPANGFFLMDVSTNKQASQVFEVSSRTQFYVKGSASTGLVYLSSYFGK